MNVTTRIAAAFSGVAFRVAEARRLGYSRSEIDHPSLARPHHGLRVAGEPGQSLRDRAVTYLPLLRPGEVFSHVTALVLYGCPIRLPAQASIDVETAVSCAQVRRPGVRGHRRRRPADPPWVPDDAPRRLDVPGLMVGVEIPASLVVPPLRALAQAAGVLNAKELIVALDHLICPHQAGGGALPLVLPEELARFLSQSRFPGMRRLRKVAALARQGSASRMETLTRLAAVSAGLPELRLQHTILDAAGAFIGRFDLALVQQRCLIEYDGEQHRTDRAQYLHDIERLDRVRAAGWRVLRLHKEDFRLNLQAVGRRLLAFTNISPIQVPAPVVRLLNEPDLFEQH